MLTKEELQLTIQILAQQPFHQVYLIIAKLNEMLNTVDDTKN